MTGERDPRAHWLDDDPFDKIGSPGSHSAARDDGNWRQPHIRVQGESDQPYHHPLLRFGGVFRQRQFEIVVIIPVHIRHRQGDLVNRCAEGHFSPFEKAL